jgi:hypothetical protein
LGPTAAVLHLRESVNLAPESRAPGKSNHSSLACHTPTFGFSSQLGMPQVFGQLGDVLRSTKSSSTIKRNHRRALGEGLIIRR